MKDFDPKKWHIRREGQQWLGGKFKNRIYQAPEKIEFVEGGIFTNERERLTVLAMILENLGIDKQCVWAIRRIGKRRSWNWTTSELDEAKHAASL